MSTSFQLVKLALDKLHDLVKEDHGTATDTYLGKKIAERHYDNLTNKHRKPNDYSDPGTRFAYVYSYVAAHSSYVRGVLRSSDSLMKKIQSADKLSVTCLGGGPGSELVGLLQVCTQVGRKGTLACWLLDSEDGWSETWSHVDAELEAEFKVNNYFRKISVTEPPNVKNLKELFSSDVFVLSYFLSEVYAFEVQCGPFFKALVSNMKKGAHVAYIDNSTKEFTDFSERIFPKREFYLEYSADQVRVLPGSAEEKTDLGVYLKKGWKTPKIEASVTQRIWRKK